MRDAYLCVAAYLGLAIKMPGADPRREPDSAAVAAGETQTIELRTEKLFREIMTLCANTRLMHGFDKANLQLRPIRRLESRWIGNAEQELGALCNAFAARDREELGRRIEAYHRRRLALVRKIAAQLNSLDRGAVSRL